jgi:hypothetical protein
LILAALVKIRRPAVASALLPLAFSSAVSRSNFLASDRKKHTPACPVDQWSENAPDFLSDDHSVSESPFKQIESTSRLICRLEQGG